VQSTGTKYTHGGKSFADFPGGNRDQRGFQFWATMWMSECYRAMKNGAPICVFTDWRQLPLMTDIMQAAGFVWRGVYVWDKPRQFIGIEYTDTYYQVAKDRLEQAA